MAKQQTTVKPDSTAGAMPAVYCGPEYLHGIQMCDSPELFRPKDFTDEERIAFLAKYPECNIWWMDAIAPETET